MSCWSAAAAPACAPPSPSPRPNPRLRVAVVSKVYPMRSHTVSAEGGAAGVDRRRRQPRRALPTTRSRAATGSATRTPSRPSSRRRPQELLQLEHWGCPWSREPDGRVAVRAVRRHEEDAHLVRRRQDRLPHAAHAVPDLAEVRRASTRYDEWFVTRLLVDDGRVHGVVAIELMTGQDRGDHRPRPSSCAPAAAAGSSRSPPTPTSRPATAWRWPTAPARR